MEHVHVDHAGRRYRVGFEADRPTIVIRQHRYRWQGQLGAWQDTGHPVKLDGMMAAKIIKKARLARAQERPR